MARPRTAQEIIDQAIRENRPAERILYGFAVIFVLCGVGTLGYGVLAGSEVPAILGVIASALFYPAMREAREIRRQNIAIRLLESPLSKAGTSEDAAVSIRAAFSEIFGGGTHGGEGTQELGSLRTKLNDGMTPPAAAVVSTAPK